MLKSAIRVDFRRKKKHNSMKKQIIADSSPYINLKDVKHRDEPPVVGFMNGGTKGFLVPFHHHTGFYEHDEVLFEARALSNFERGNGWSKGDQTVLTLEGWIRYLSSSQMFLFETPKELFAWLSE